MNKYINIFIINVITIICGLVLIYAWFMRLTGLSTVGTVDVNNIVNHYVRETAQSGFDNEKIEQNTQRFMKQLEKEIEKLSAEKKVVLLMHEAVLKGAIDYTDVILKNTEAALKSGEISASQKK